LKPTPSIATLIAATQTQDIESSEDKHHDATQHDAGNPT
jgi:hypothetical protein